MSIPAGARTRTGPGGSGARPLAGFALALALISPTAAADALDSPPERWAARIQPVPEPDVQGADAVAQELLKATRAEVASRLGDPEVTALKLGRALGDLGALYHVYEIDRAAQACYANAIELDPENFRWRYYAGYLALESGRLEDALERLREARGIDPDYAPLSLRLGEALLGLNRPEAARPLLEQAAEEPGLRAAALFHLGQLDLLEREPERAAERFQESLRLAPEADRIHYPLAQALRAAGRSEEARAHLARHGKRDPEAQDPLVRQLEELEQGSRPHFVEAMRAMRKSDYETAVAALARGLELEPDNINARLSYARVLYLDGDRKAARRELLQVLEQDPEQPLAQFLLGILDEAAGDEESAQRRYRRVLEIEPGHSGAHFFLGAQAFRDGDYEAAARHYGAAFRASPDAEPAGLLHFVARERAGAEHESLRRELEEALQRDPDRPLLRYALVRLLAASDEPSVRDGTRALEEARQLRDSAPPTPYNQEAMVLAMAAAGQADEALDALDRLIGMAQWHGEWKLARRLDALRGEIQEGEVPGPAWPEEDPALAPQPTDPERSFAMYPAGRAY